MEEEADSEAAAGYKCVKCEEEVDIDPVEDKVICPMCSHRVLFKLRSGDPKKVEAV